MQHFLSDLRSLFLYHIIAAPFLFCKANWWWWKQKQHIQRYNILSATIHLCEMSDFKTFSIHFLCFVSCFPAQNKQIFNSLDAFVKTCNLISLSRHSHAWWLCGWTFILITKYYFLTSRKFLWDLVLGIT